MPIREEVNSKRLNKDAILPFELRLKDFEIAMQDVYDFSMTLMNYSTRKASQGWMIP